MTEVDKIAFLMAILAAGWMAVPEVTLEDVPVGKLLDLALEIQSAAASATKS